MSPSHAVPPPLPEPVEVPQSLVDVLRAARHVEVFTGAGISADSGLDTFRDAETGIWSKVDPQAMASIDAWLHDPEPMWAWYLWRATVARRAAPNAGHRAIARWAERAGVEVHVTTQNIDDLHERAGSTDVAHLHGSLYDFRCSRCDAPAPMPELLTEPVARATPPACAECGHDVRPGVVWFGEALPAEQWQAAEEAMSNADLVVIVGTSGIVQPAASLPLVGLDAGATLVEISPQESRLTGLCHYHLSTTAAAGLPALLAALD